MLQVWMVTGASFALDNILRWRIWNFLSERPHGSTGRCQFSIQFGRIPENMSRYFKWARAALAKGAATTINQLTRGFFTPKTSTGMMPKQTVARRISNSSDRSSVPYLGPKKCRPAQEVTNAPRNRINERSESFWTKLHFLFGTVDTNRFSNFWTSDSDGSLRPGGERTHGTFRRGGGRRFGRGDASGGGR